MSKSYQFWILDGVLASLHTRHTEVFPGWLTTFLLASKSCFPEFLLYAFAQDPEVFVDGELALETALSRLRIPQRLENRTEAHIAAIVIRTDL